MTRWHALQIWFGQWRLRALGRADARVVRSAQRKRDVIDKRADWWTRWVHRLLP